MSDLLPRPGADRVRDHTSAEVLERLDRDLDARIASTIAAGPGSIRARLRALESESDVERLLEGNAATLMLVSITAAAVTRRRGWLVLCGGVAGFLLQHAVQGWCPPLALLRRWGVRTRSEIETERMALRAAVGDLAGYGAEGAGGG